MGIGLIGTRNLLAPKKCNILNILNKLILQEELQNIVTNNVFLDKNNTTVTKQKKIKYKKPLPEPGIEPGTSCTQSGCVRTAPPS